MRHMNMPNEREVEQEHRPSHMSLPHMNKRQAQRKSAGRAWLPGSQTHSALPRKQWPLDAHLCCGSPLHMAHPGVVNQ